jgi:predicted permease
MNDLRYGLRSLLKTPGFTGLAVLALALGIGANSAIFSVVNAVLLRPLPYAESERLVRVGGMSLRKPEAVGTFSPQDFYDWRAQSTSFEAVAAFDQSSPSLTGAGEPERLNAARVTPEFFTVLRAQPALGRGFVAQEGQRGNHRVAVLTHALWQRRFAASPSVVGQQIELSGEPFTVVGVLPENFESPQFSGFEQEQPELFTVFAPDLSQWTRGGRSVDAGVARLRPGVSVEQAQAEMDAIAARLREQYPDTNANAGARVVSLHEQLVGGARTSLLVFLAAVGFVLLIACANVANMMLARASSRHREVAIRTALGATRLRIVRQFLTESVMLSLAGGAVGLLLAMWANDLLLAVGADAIPRANSVALDWRVLAFTLAASALTGVAFGVVPAVHATRLDLQESLKEGGRGQTGGRARRRVRGLLVVSEVALSLVLLAGAGLLIKSFLRLQGVDPGFEPSGVLTMNVFLPGARYPEDAQHPVFFERVLEGVRALPGVEHAGATSNLPISGNYDRMPLYVEGQPDPPSGDEPEIERYMVSDDYFGALGVPLVAGRAFDGRDQAETPRACVVGRALAERFWPAGEAVGKRIKLGDAENPWVEVVGVAGDVRHYGLDAEANMQVYLPHRQSPSQVMTLVVRSKGDARSLASAVRERVWAVDAAQPVYGVKTMDELLSASVAARRFQMLLVGLFAAVALALALVGIYGVMSYTVTQRTHEIGIRMALGAQPRDVLRLIIGQGMSMTLAGVAAGLAGALLLTRAMEGLLYGVSATDPMTFAAVALLLGAVAFLSCYVPARRATKVDPMEALRYE